MVTAPVLVWKAPLAPEKSSEAVPAPVMLEAVGTERPAVTVPAVKLPDESRLTIVDTVLALVAAFAAVVAVATFAAVAPPTVATVAAVEPGPVAVTSPVRAVM